MEHTQKNRANRLIKENSPYLLQHAYNPVDWYPWGEEAFAKARAEDKLIFLSIGYSTCHWCHVMERETFENDEIAQIFNDYVVAIKVDREERPDIDHLYMTFVQAMTGQGGWPMNLFLTPDKKPIYGATYIPPEPKFGMPGIRELLEAVHSLWLSDRSRALAYSEDLVQKIRDFEEAKRSDWETLTDYPVSTLRGYYQEAFDASHGGFSDKPKFPQPHAIRFLLDQAALNGDDTALGMAEKTLLEIYRGGIHDHLGGGYARYSVDEKWLVPHFEKMLYDNAGLLENFALAYLLTGRPLYRTFAKDITGYLGEVMTDPSGAFYAAEDADSEGVEGKFYVFSYQEVIDVLGNAAAEFMAVYDVIPEGNFEGANILNLLHYEEADPGQAARVFHKERQLLKERRDQRVRPHKDDKILAAWNGRMISALALAGRIFAEPAFLAQAQAAAQALKIGLWRGNELSGSMRLGKSGNEGVLEDYAGYCLGFLDLFEATFNKEYLDHALEVFRVMEDKFKAEGGGYRLGNNNSGLIYNPVDAQDSASAGGNSLVAHILLKMAGLTYDDQFNEKLKEHFGRFSKSLREYPQALAAMTDALALWQGNRRELILCGPSKADLIAEFSDALAQKPVNTTLLILAADSPDFLEHEFLAGIPRSKVQLFHCSQMTCSEPVTSPEAIRRVIRGGEAARSR